MTEGVPEIVRFSAGLDDLDPDLESKPRRRIAAENYNDYLHATRTFSGNETPDTLTEVRRERFRILQVQMMMMMMMIRILMMMMMIMMIMMIMMMMMMITVVIIHATSSMPK